MEADTPIENLPKTAAATINRLKSIGINTYFDLINYFPYRYLDYQNIITIKQMRESLQNKIERVTLVGEVRAFDNVYTRRHIQIQKAQIKDNTGLTTVTWFNQPYLRQIMTVGTTISLAGMLEAIDYGVVLRPEQYESVTTTPLHTGRLVPVYTEKRGLSSRLLREKIHYVLNSLEIAEFLPKEIIKKQELMAEEEAIRQIHFPDSLTLASSARHRLEFDELFTISLSSQLVRQRWREEVVGTQIDVKKNQSKIDEFVKSLPFELTAAQQKTSAEILHDLEQKWPMNRLLQGDVGSGKTVVAAIAAIAVAQNGYKTLLMAPTEILAQQHFATISTFMKSVALVTSSSKPDSETLDKSDIIIGTHALIAKSRFFDKVALVIIDEQHKFGVAQRATLKNLGQNPHLLTITATPIPRTVSLSLYGELDVSIIDEMPKNRLAVKTHLVPKQKRGEAYSWIQKLIKEDGIQVFIVCPLIDPSEKESMTQVKAAAQEFEKLRTQVFPELKLMLLHGRMKSIEKEAAMQQFGRGKVDILVSTPVVEVGVDIPNANIIVIEASERFGLAQLHQLRGRVGRGDKQAYCLLFTEATNPTVTARLNMFKSSNDGFALAQYDLTHRGTGDLYGIKQHGSVELKVATLSDLNLLKAATVEANSFVEDYKPKLFPELKKRLDAYQTDAIARD